MVLGGGALIFAGRRAKRREAAFKRCMTVSGNTGLVRIAGLAKTLGLGEEDLEKQLEEMIDRGYYGERAYVDHARGLLVIEPEQMRDVYRVEDEAKAAARSARKTADEMTAMSEYEKFLEQIRQADEDIADETMSEKIRTMRELTAAIFQEVEEHPAKKPQIQRFMNYYLPTTLKLLDSYARIEQQGSEPAFFQKRQRALRLIVQLRREIAVQKPPALARQAVRNIQQALPEGVGLHQLVQPLSRKCAPHRFLQDGAHRLIIAPVDLMEQQQAHLRTGRSWPPDRSKGASRRPGCPPQTR